MGSKKYTDLEQGVYSKYFPEVLFKDPNRSVPIKDKVESFYIFLKTVLFSGLILLGFWIVYNYFM